MAVVCADCRTENRDGAKFCRGCGRRLVAIASAGTKPPPTDDWPETQRIPLPPPVAPPGLFGSGAPARPKALDEVEKKIAASAAKRQSSPLPAYPSPAAAFRPPAPTAARPSRNVRKAPPRRSSALWISVAAFFVITGTLVTAGSWYISSKQAAQTPLAAASEPVASAPVEPAPATSIAPNVEPASGNPGSGPAPAPAPVAEAAAPALPAVAAKPAVLTPPKVRKPSAAPAPAPLPPPTVAVAPPPASTPAPPPEPVAPANPQAVCAGLNFISRSQCMAAQCAKADYRALPQCDAVRRQQQIDEEKRNPSLAN